MKDARTLTTSCSSTDNSHVCSSNLEIFRKWLCNQDLFSIKMIYGLLSNLPDSAGFLFLNNIKDELRQRLELSDKEDKFIENKPDEVWPPDIQYTKTNADKFLDKYICPDKTSRQIFESIPEDERFHFKLLCEEAMKELKKGYDFNRHVLWLDRIKQVMVGIWKD